MFPYLYNFNNPVTKTEIPSGSTDARDVKPQHHCLVGYCQAPINPAWVESCPSGKRRGPPTTGSIGSHPSNINSRIFLQFQLPEDENADFPSRYRPGQCEKHQLNAHDECLMGFVKSGNDTRWVQKFQHDYLPSSKTVQLPVASIGVVVRLTWISM